MSASPGQGWAGIAGGCLLIYGFALFGYQLVAYFGAGTWTSISLFDVLAGMPPVGPAAWASTGSPLLPALTAWLDQHSVIAGALRLLPLALSSILCGLGLILVDAVHDARHRKD